MIGIGTFFIAAALLTASGVLAAPTGENQYLAPPEAIRIDGASRRAVISTALGMLEMRWPRKVESLFGRTPERALIEAASAAARALRQPGFPAELGRLNLDWKLVFLDEEMPEKQIPTALISNCHPAWMTPPANLYIVGQRAAAGCGGVRGPGGGIADAQLAKILLHEMGHAVEYQFLGDIFARSRMRAEGFASWFEAYAGRFSSIIPKGESLDLFRTLAAESISETAGEFNFQGSARDYARAAMYFEAISDRRGVRGIFEVYSKMKETNLDFLDAAKAVLKIDDRRLEALVRRSAGLKN